MCWRESDVPRNPVGMPAYYKEFQHLLALERDCSFYEKMMILIYKGNMKAREHGTKMHSHTEEHQQHWDNSKRRGFQTDPQKRLNSKLWQSMKKSEVDTRT